MRLYQPQNRGQTHGEWRQNFKAPPLVDPLLCPHFGLEIKEWGSILRRSLVKSALYVFISKFVKVHFWRYMSSYNTYTFNF
jgi:hypothetical protein